MDQILDIIPDDLDILVQKAAYAQAEGDLPRASALLAPLHPPAGNSGALETQVYQAILERRPAPVISRLKEILAKPDLGLGYLNGELRFWLGWAQDIAGERASAQETWKQARSELETFLKEQPENFVLIGDLALTNAVLGDKAAALSLAERAMTAMPLEKDAMLWFLPALLLQFPLVALGSALRATGIVQPTVILQVLSIVLNIVLAPFLIFGTGHTWDRGGLSWVPSLCQRHRTCGHSGGCGCNRDFQLQRRPHRVFCRCRSPVEEERSRRYRGIWGWGRHDYKRRRQRNATQRRRSNFLCRNFAHRDGGVCAEAIRQDKKAPR